MKFERRAAGVASLARQQGSLTGFNAAFAAERNGYKNEKDFINFGLLCNGDDVWIGNFCC